MKSPFNNNSFKEIQYEELSKEIGNDFVVDDLNIFLLKISEVMGKNEIPLLLIKNLYDNTFSIYEQNDGRLLLILDHNFKTGGYLCKMIYLMNIMAAKSLETFRVDLYNSLYDSSKANIIDELFNINELPENDKLSDYFYNLAIIFIYEFNLDIIKSKVTLFDEKRLIISGEKSEFIYNEKQGILENQDIIYNIVFYSNLEIIDVVKIFEDNKKKTYSISLTDFFLQDTNLLFK